jgi:hypothetical protein
LSQQAGVSMTKERMLCPKCGREYRKGLVVCPVCQIILTEKPKPNIVPQEKINKKRLNAPKSNSKENPWVGCLQILAAIIAFSLIVSLLAMIGAGIIYLGFIFGGITLLALFISQKRLLDIIALCLGICLFAGSALVYFNTQSFINNSVVTEGIVVGYKETNDEDDIASAIIEFNTRDGETIRFDDHYLSTPSKDEEVKVLYNPTNPSEARIYKWLSLWSWDVLMLGIGIPAIVIAAKRLRRHKIQQTTEQTHA